MIDTASPPGSYRSALNPAASCKACAQSVCGCEDLVYAGVVPPLTPNDAADATPAASPRRGVSPPPSYVPAGLSLDTVFHPAENARA